MFDSSSSILFWSDEWVRLLVWPHTIKIRMDIWQFISIPSRYSLMWCRKSAHYFKKVYGPANNAHFFSREWFLSLASLASIMASFILISIGLNGWCFKARRYSPWIDIIHMLSPWPCWCYPGHTDLKRVCVYASYKSNHFIPRDCCCCV